MGKPKVLLIDEYGGWQDHTAACLGDLYDIVPALTLAAGLAAVQDRPWDLIILNRDLTVEQQAMGAALTLVKESGLTPMLLVSGDASAEAPGVLVQVVARGALQDPPHYRDIVRQLLAQRTQVVQGAAGGEVRCG